MNLNESFHLVTHSQAYQQWITKNKDSFLCSFFRIREKNPDPPLQVDFYDPKKDTISSFVVDHGIVTLQQDGVEALKKKEEVIQQLHLEHVKLSEEEAMTLVRDVLERDYPQEQIIKFIIILQCKEQARWNISAIMHSLHLFNVKIDAATGNILDKSFTNLLGFVQKQDE
ncbi:MAG: hypothetical protein AABX72_04170 [Nanoarchaeota archaeon]